MQPSFGIRTECLRRGMVAHTGIGYSRELSDPSLNVFSQESAEPSGDSPNAGGGRGLARLRDWWKGKRRVFLAGVRDYLHEALGEESVCYSRHTMRNQGPA